MKTLCNSTARRIHFRKIKAEWRAKQVHPFLGHPVKEPSQPNIRKYIVVHLYGVLLLRLVKPAVYCTYITEIKVVFSAELLFR
jgi:hypothetical protein